MKQWQFFLETPKESQLIPINTPDYQLSPGNYRLVAQTNLANTLIEIRLDYPSGLELFHKYWRSTDAHGFLIITPFLNLEEGCLRLRCQADILAELEGNGWQTGLNLHIVQQGLTPLNPQEPSLKLELEAETIFKTTATRASLIGTIKSNYPDFQTALLTYRLYNPKTGTTLLSQSQDLNQISLPCKFVYDLELHPSWDTCLIVGEISLETVFPQSTLSTSSYFQIIDHSEQLLQRWRKLASRLNPSAYPRLDLLDIHTLSDKAKTCETLASEQAFAELELEKRFWSRINKLANYQRQK